MIVVPMLLVSARGSLIEASPTVFSSTLDFVEHHGEAGGERAPETCCVSGTGGCP